MSPAHIAPLVLAPLIAWRLKQRFSRNIGRQTFRPKRTIFSVVIMTIAIAVIGTSMIHLGNTPWSLLGGLAAGFVVSFFGCKLTKFEVVEGEKFYTPNAYLGTVISVLLVLRIGYRLFILYTMSDSLPPTTPDFGQSPLTFFVIGLTFGYYLAFNSFLLFRLLRTVPRTERSLTTDRHG